MESVICVLIVFLFLELVSGFPDQCPKSGRLANIFLNEDLLKNSEVYRDFSNAKLCHFPGLPCSDPNICNVQLEGFPVSNLIPCCVKLENGSSVCQCVVKIPNSNKCPRKNLILVSNQTFNMTGDSKFFNQTYPICSSLHNSLNIYKGKRCPVMPNIAVPFIKPKGISLEKVGFQFFRADKFGDYCVNFYIEFLLTCKTDQAFISDDLKLCSKPCNDTLPFAEIWMDIPATHLNDPNNDIFYPLKSTSKCDTEATTNDQCPAKTTNLCHTTETPCCYSKNFMFPYNPMSNTCPCPPPQDNLIMAINAVLTCNILLNANNRIYLFKGDNPPRRLVFNWDLNFNGPIGGPDKGIFLFGRGTVILPLKSGGESLYWLAELKLPGSVFKGCVAEIVGTLKTTLPFSLEALEN